MGGNSGTSSVGGNAGTSTNVNISGNMSAAEMAEVLLSLD